MHFWYSIWQQEESVMDSLDELDEHFCSDFEKHFFLNKFEVQTLDNSGQCCEVLLLVMFATEAVNILYPAFE